MNISRKFTVPALIAGIVLLGGGTAFAAENGIDVTKLSGFTDAQKSAIEQAFQIRQNAHEQAQALLESAGVDEEQLHEAMRAGHEERRTQMNAALDSNDYAAFALLVADSPMADKLTSDTFAKLVEIRELEKDGKQDEAHELRKSLGFGPGMGGKQGDMRGERPPKDI